MEGSTGTNRDAIKQAPSLEAMHERLTALEKQFKGFRIIGDGTVNFSGSMDKGFTATFDDSPSSV